MARYTTIDQLSLKHRLLLGFAISAAALLTAVIVHYNPHRLQAPSWVAFLSCGSLLFAGVSILLRSLVPHRIFLLLMSLLLASLTAIPAWIAFGSGRMRCTNQLVILLTDSHCRVVFGAATLLMGVLTIAAIVDALRPSSSSG